MIGIIGGNGVAATNKLCSLVEELSTRNGAFRDAHHPEMLVWYATQAPSRSMYLEGRGPSWIEDYVAIGKKLRDSGCTELCMCCNTAHYAVDALQKQIGIPFVNLLDKVVLHCRSVNARKVGIMCTAGLRKVGLYEKRFSVLAPEIELIYPNDAFQEQVTLGICNAKNKIRFLDAKTEPMHPANCFERVCAHLEQDKNVDTIIAGCTDISNVYSRQGVSNSRYVDSLVVLAEYIIAHHSPK